MFANNPDVTDLSYAFYVCKSLSSIPEALFENNTKVTSFERTFERCIALTTVPISLFDHNRKALHFIQAFDQCGLSGESPYTIINGVKYHLYERKYNEDEFVSPESFAECFGRNYELSDYNRIPQSWGGGKQDESDQSAAGGLEGVNYENW